MNPVARVVALEKPTERELTQWYFQRYIQHLPAAGEIVMFDRSWYNRAGVERVMGYCTPHQYLEFTRSAPEFEQMLVNSGIHLVKFWFSVGRAEQHAQFVSRPPTRSSSGSCRPPTLPRWTSGTPTPRPRRRCSSTPTRLKRRGRWSSPMTRSARASRPCVGCSPSSTTRTKDVHVVGKPDSKVIGSPKDVYDEGRGPDQLPVVDPS